MVREFNPEQEWDEKNGSIRIANEVVGVIAGLAAMEVKGVYGMSGGMVSRRKTFLKGLRLRLVRRKRQSISI